jgi:hypothetical protein
MAAREGAKEAMNTGGRGITRWLVAATLLVAACAGNPSPGTNPTPVAPPVATVPAALPSGGAVAIIPVKVTYVLRALRPSLDSLFPVRDSLTAARCASAGGLVCHQYVYRRDSLTLRSTGDRLSIETHLGYRAQLGVIGGARVASCGYAPEEMRRADLAISTALYWRKDWRIGSRDTKLAATLVDPCRVTALGVNATPTLQSIVDKQLATFAAQADSAIPQVAEFRTLADSLWKSFLEPTPLDSTNSMWLLIEPEAVRVTPFASSGPTLTTTLVLYARPRIIAGAKPAVRARPLPGLALGTAPAEFSVPVTAELPFDELARQATVLMQTETGKSSVRVDSVFVRGAQDSVFVDLAVSGAIKGRLSLTSRMRWDATTRELRLDDLDWTLQSRGALSRVTSTLAAPLVGRAIRKATNGGKIALGAQLDSTRTELLTMLNGTLAPGIVMGSSVREVQILSVSTSATAFVVRALLTGQSGVWIQ